MSFTTALLIGAVLSAEPAPGDAAPFDPCERVGQLVTGGPLSDAARAQLFGLGREALPALVDALSVETDPDTALVLLDAIAAAGSIEIEPAIRRHLFSDNPMLAAAATRALGAITRTRAVPVLERLLREDRSYLQTLAAIQGLESYGVPRSFPELVAYAENPARDPQLRAEAARVATELDGPKARKWLKKMRPAADTNPFYLAEIQRLTTLFLGPTNKPKTTLR